MSSEAVVEIPKWRSKIEVRAARITRVVEDPATFDATLYFDDIGGKMVVGPKFVAMNKVRIGYYFVRAPGLAPIARPPEDFERSYEPLATKDYRPDVAQAYLEELVGSGPAGDDADVIDDHVRTVARKYAHYLLFQYEEQIADLQSQLDGSHK